MQTNFSDYKRKNHFPMHIHVLLTPPPPLQKKRQREFCFREYVSALNRRLLIFCKFLLRKKEKLTRSIPRWNTNTCKILHTADIDFVSFSRCCSKYSAINFNRSKTKSRIFVPLYVISVINHISLDYFLHHYLLD